MSRINDWFLSRFLNRQRVEAEPQAGDDIEEFVVSALRPSSSQHLDSWKRAQDQGGWLDTEDKVVAFLKRQIDSGRRTEVIEWMRTWLEDPPSCQHEVEIPMNLSSRLAYGWSCISRWAYRLELSEMGPDLEHCAQAAAERIENSAVAELLKRDLEGIAYALIPEEELLPATTEEEFDAKLQWREPRRERKPRAE